MSSKNSSQCVLDSVSIDKAFSFLPSLSRLNEPSLSRAAIAGASLAYQAGFYKDLEYCGPLGEGAVFVVSLCKHKVNRREYAVKRTKLGKKQSRDVGDNPAGGIFSALTEIHVIWHEDLKRHENIVEIFNWDWSEDRIPVIIVEYAPYGTLRDFLQSGRESDNRLQREFGLDIAAGLSALHAYDVAHGDVKLNNTLVFPHGQRGFRAKISDFSHAVFGVSARRKSTYPGSSLYNAPEIRARDAVIASDLLPCCEAFSYGLLLWEVLKKGSPFIEPEWVQPICDRNSCSVEDAAKEFLKELPKDVLLSKALGFLNICHNLSRVDRSIFCQVFEMTLRDDSRYRKDMSAVAIALDYCDRASILSPTNVTKVETISYWAFDPWDRTIPWVTQTQFVQEFESVVEQPMQPSHAELHFLLARCYAEGYGVQISNESMFKHLSMAAHYGSIEARLMLGASQDYHQMHPKSPGDRDQSRVSTMPEDLVPEALRRALDRIDRDAALSKSRYLGRLQLWNQENQKFGHSRPFVWDSKTYFWNKDEDKTRLIDTSDRSDIPVWRVIVSHETLDSTLRIGPILEVAVTIGAKDWLETAFDHAVSHQGMHHDDQLSTLHQLLVVSVRTGQKQIIAYLLERISHYQRTPNGMAQPSGATPFHFLAMLEANEQEIKSIATQFQEVGINVENVVYSRSWLDPTGLEVYGSALQMAVQIGCFHVVEALLTLGANPLLTKVKQPNPLEMAFALHLPDIVTLFLKNIHHLPKPLGKYATALSSVTSKGAFDRMLLHPHHQAFLSDFQATFDLVALGKLDVKETRPLLVEVPRENNLSAEEEELAISSSVQYGPKDPVLLRLLLLSGVRLRSNEAKARVLEELSARIGDDPRNRGLLRNLLGTEPEGAPWQNDWNGFFQKYWYCDNREGGIWTLLEHWTARNLVNNVRDLLIHPGVTSMITTGDEHKHTPFEITIRRDLLEMYQLLEPFHSHVDTYHQLALAVESSALKVITHIVQRRRGTIYCRPPESRYTALHHAVSLSNPRVIQHLLELRVPVEAMLNETAHELEWEEGPQLGHNNYLEPFQSIPVFHMRENSVSRSFTALETAIFNRDIASVRALIQYARANNAFCPLPPYDHFTALKDAMPTTCLAFAIQKDEMEIAKLMRTNPQCSAFCRSSGLTVKKNGRASSFTADTLTRESRLDGWTFVNETILGLCEGWLQLDSFLSLVRFGDPKGQQSMLPTTMQLLRRVNPFANVQLWNGWQPIHYAIFCANADAVSAFLDAGTLTTLRASSLNVIKDPKSLREKLSVWAPLFDYSELFIRDRKLDKEGEWKNMYRHAGLWGPNQKHPSSLDIREVHDLLWLGKSCLEMAGDLLAWNEQVKVPRPSCLRNCTLEERKQVYEMLLLAQSREEMERQGEMDEVEEKERQKKEKKERQKKRKEGTRKEAQSPFPRIFL